MKISRFGAGKNIELSDGERNRLGTQLEGMRYPEHLHYGEYIDEVRRAWIRAVGYGLLEEVLSAFRSPRPEPFVRIQNLPKDPLIPPTPMSGERATKPTSVSENILIAIGEGTGGYCYGQQTEGEQLVNQVIPQENREHTGLGYRLELEYHIENAALRYLFGNDRAPWLLGLTDVRVDLSAAPATRVSDGLRAEETLPDRQRQTLREARFEIRVPYRWDSLVVEDRRWTPPVPIIDTTQYGPRITAAFYGGLSRAVDEEAGEALKAYKAALETCGDRVTIANGTAVFICNDIAFHAREPFDPKFQGGRAGRWLQRIFVARERNAFEGWETQSDRIFCPR